MNAIFKLEPYISAKIWGYEKWALSTHKSGESLVLPGREPLSSVIGQDFPILVKIIRAEDTLSVQVHPGDEYARLHENDSGKTECWYILDAKPAAALVCGFKGSLTRKALQKIIDEDHIKEYLQEIPVHTGDMVYIPSGTVHAIKGGITLLEVQQSSNVTYRLYDWGRGREIHIQKSLDVIDYEGKNPGRKIAEFTRLETPFFTVEKIHIKGKSEQRPFLTYSCYTVISGSGSIRTADGVCIEVSAEDTVLVMPGFGITMEGKLDIMQILPPQDTKNGI